MDHRRVASGRDQDLARIEDYPALLPVIAHVDGRIGVENDAGTVGQFDFADFTNPCTVIRDGGVPDVGLAHRIG